MRSSITESRPMPGPDQYQYWQDPRLQSPGTPQLAASSRRQLTLAPLEGWLPLILLSIAVYSVVYSVTAAITISHNTNPVLWITTAMGLLCGLIVSKTRFLPQAILHIGACIAGYWLALFLTSALAYQVSVLVLLSSLRTVIMGGLASTGSQNSDMAFLFYLSFLCFFLGYFGSWLIYRAHLPWLVALVYVSIMIVNLNYITKRDLSFLIIILAGSLVLLIARVQLASQIIQWKSDGLHTDNVWLRNINGRFLRLATLFMLLILPFSWLLPTISQPSSGATLWNNLDNAWANLSHGKLPSLSDPSGLFSPYSPPGNFFSDQLSITSSVNLPKGPVLSYTSSDAQGHYLEAFAYDTFDGHTWISQAGSTNQSYGVNEQLPQENSQANYTSLTTRVTVIQPPGGSKYYIFAPSAPGSFSIPVTLYTDTTGNLISAWTQTSPLSVHEQYEASSDLTEASPSDLQTVPLPSQDHHFWTEDPNYNIVQQYYLQKPNTLSSQVLSTAEAWTTGAQNAYDLAMDLQTHLSNTAVFTYSLENKPVPAGTDAVTWLLQTRQGFCTYYATAMVVMARQLGLPARMVNGFSSGNYDATQQDWVVDGTDAHSWVQVYFPGYGWINFDPTPGFSNNATTSPGGAVTPTPAVTPSKASSTPAPHTNPTGQATQTTRQAHGTPTTPLSNDLGSGNLIIMLALIILLCSLLLLLLASIRYRYRSRHTAISSVYARLCRVASLVGSPPARWQTPYEYTFTLSKRFPQASASLRQLADLFVRERWAARAQTPAPTEERDVERLWPRLRNTILRSPLSKGK